MAALGEAVGERDGVALGYAAASGGVAWLVASQFAGEGALARLVAGGVVLAVAYLPILARWKS